MAKKAKSKKAVKSGVNARKLNKSKAAAKPETKIVSPPSILELTEVAATIGKIKVPDNMVKQRDKLADAATKLSKRIFSGLDSEEKKQAREAKAKVRSEAKTKRDAARNDKKLARITKLKEQLAALESPAADKK